MTKITAEHIAKHAKEFHYGGNCTGSNLKDNLANVSWKQATTKIGAFNTIATLVFHINYYIDIVLRVLEGGSLEGSDKYSFELPPINSEKDWNNLLDKVWRDADKFSNLIEKLPDEKLWKNMADEKYGDFYRNLNGIIEHSYYHLGQITLVKKLVQEKNDKT